jgi:hypothetical protein
MVRAVEELEILLIKGVVEEEVMVSRRFILLFSAVDFECLLWKTANTNTNTHVCC